MWCQRVAPLYGMRQELRGVPLGDDAYRAATHLETGFGGVRLGRLDLRIALSSSLSSSLACKALLAFKIRESAPQSQRVPLPPPAMSDDLFRVEVGVDGINRGARSCCPRLKTCSVWWWLAGGGVKVVKSCWEGQCCVPASNALTESGRLHLGM
jgi:hypothetical protein